MMKNNEIDSTGMNKEIYVLGIGHNTPVYLDLVESCGYTIKGLYHYNDERVGELDHGYPIIGSFNDLFSLNSLEGMNFALSQGDNKMRATILKNCRKERECTHFNSSFCKRF
ncbi:hypothetical protein ACIXNK_14655 [Bacteroides fragilis]